ncbi:outer membrane protein assembly factor BamD [Neptuniibacter sp. CAU 1671]|uniref:outer membrane protein assembly factor BamD n=1 Tax=Neptuniibacter sp. CAU 1671 TaxID=3032593 RepID=UPI0023DB5578|nr:outer membrane protein assembly factor BamD [Neptuniibacter sp. CAU 1671]MDF2182324.1 outer membrane protein assembly factor BamD [Neptuniibacter sp. CAU 1671]
MPLTRIISILLFSFALSACSWFKDKLPEPDIPEQQLYEEALQAMDLNDWDLALEKLQLLEARYPFGRFSEQAQLELIYAYFNNYEPEAARAAADRFIRLHPNHDNIDYAYYLKGLTAFEQDRSWVASYLPVDESKRDPGAALESFESFNQLVTRYPDSQFSPDAQKRMVYLKNRLAAYEVHVARYYIKRGAYVAAVNRGRYVVENMQETPALADALGVQVEAYTLLGRQQLAADTLAVLQENFPDYQYTPAYKAEKSLLDAATFDLFSSAEEPPPPVLVTESIPAPERSLFSKLTFGLFDDDEEKPSSSAE